MKTKVDELYEDYQNADYDTRTSILNQGESTDAKATELSNAYYVASQNNVSGEDLGNEEDYRYYSNEYITNTLDVDGIDRDFFVNIRTRSVLLVTGIEYQNETYYSLCQIEDEQYGVKYTQNPNIPEGWSVANKLNIANDWYAYKDISSESDNIAKVNAPKLADGMTPIKYIGEDETTNSTVAQLTSGSRWANAVTKDGSMWVWIPRYAYRITSGYHTNTAGTIEIAFLDNENHFLDSNITGTVKTGDITDSDYGENASWILEPAFEFGGESISGFWFAKFEASNTDGYGSDSSTANKTDLTLQIKPNERTWTYISAKNIFTVCQELTSNTNYNKYFNSVTNIDTHMTKNIEWGAVSYLTHSQYGVNKTEVYINNYSGLKTGIGGTTVNASASNDDTNQYNTIVGINASTSKNIYGIYDMNGGSVEYVSACSAGTTINLTNNTDINFLNKYIDVYSDYSISKYGDAVYETSNNTQYAMSWFKDYSMFYVTNNNILKRGGSYNQSTNAGLFNFSYAVGIATTAHGFRPVCVVY